MPRRRGDTHWPPTRTYTLFFTEMWERFSYYGMRALLVLFMVDAVRGGMGLTEKVATAIYGLYTARFI
jgi:POT family proton-dependent oligopeptide transporter